MPREDSWDTAKYLAYAPNLFAEVRKAFGEEILLLHDVHHRCTPIEAARLAKELEPYHLFWLEDPAQPSWKACAL
jgi:mannonate dehydratase